MNKRFHAFLLAALMVISLVPSAIFAEDITTIGDLATLKEFRDSVNAGNTYSGKTVTLTADIDLNNEEWTPIGNSSNKFQGVFDGGNHTISNLKIDQSAKSDIGFFGFTTNGEIKNLTIRNAKIAGYLDVGVVAGTPYTSKYTNIKVTGHVEVDGFAYVGAVGGKNAYANWTDVTVDVDSTSYVAANSVEGSTAYRTYVGGVIGFIGEGGHSFTNISSNITVIGSTIDVGGIAGIAHYGNKFNNVSCSGKVVLTEGEDMGDALEVGGIAGTWHNGGSDVTFTGCSFTGSIEATYEENGVKYTLTEDDMANDGLTGYAYSPSNFENGTLKVDGKDEWKDKVVAKVGDTEYTLPELSDAIAAAKADGKTVEMKETIKVPSGVTFGDVAVELPQGVNLKTSEKNLNVVDEQGNKLTATGSGYVNTVIPPVYPAYAGPVMNWVKVNTADNGVVKSGPLAASAGATVTLYPKAAEGFVLDTIEVLDAEGNAVALDGLKFAIPAGGVTVNATFKAAQ